MWQILNLAQNPDRNNERFNDKFSPEFQHLLLPNFVCQIHSGLHDDFEKRRDFLIIS